MTQSLGLWLISCSQFPGGSAVQIDSESKEKGVGIKIERKVLWDNALGHWKDLLLILL